VRIINNVHTHAHTRRILIRHIMYRQIDIGWKYSRPRLNHRRPTTTICTIYYMDIHMLLPIPRCCSGSVIGWACVCVCVCMWTTSELSPRLCITSHIRTVCKTHKRRPVIIRSRVQVWFMYVQTLYIYIYIYRHLYNSIIDWSARSAYYEL